MEKDLLAFFNAINQSVGMQIGLPNGYFYYSIPANFEQDFLKYNQKLKQKKLLLKGKKE